MLTLSIFVIFYIIFLITDMNCTEETFSCLLVHWSILLKISSLYFAQSFRLDHHAKIYNPPKSFFFSIIITGGEALKV